MGVYQVEVGMIPQEKMGEEKQMKRAFAWGLLAGGLLGITLFGLTHRVWADELPLPVSPSSSVMTSFEAIHGSRLERIPLVEAAESVQASGIQPVAMDAENLVQAATSAAEQAAVLTPADTMAQPAAVANSPKPAYLVFPVMAHESYNKAFSDLPVVLSTAVANQLAQKVSASGLNYTVMNPIYAYDLLKSKSQDKLATQLIRDYQASGEPNATDLQTLADLLSNEQQRVTWVVFVSAGFDLDHVTRPYLAESLIYNLADLTPPQPNYFLEGQVQVFTVTNPSSPIWSKASKSRIQLNRFENFTTSVMDDSDSSLHFRSASNTLAKTLVGKMLPPATVEHTGVSGTLINLVPPATTTPTP